MALHPLRSSLPALFVLGACAADHAPSPPPPLALLQEVRSDSVQAISSVQLLPNGTLLIADRRARRIWAFDSLGHLLPPVGREGAGPGEYREPYALAAVGDTIAVLDPRNARIGLFSVNGGWLGSRPAPPITGGNTIRLYRAPGPVFYAYALVSRDSTRRPAYLAYRPGGGLDTLPIPTGARTSPGITCNGSDRGIRFFAVPFGAVSVFLPGPGETLLTGTTARYALALIGPLGDTVAHFRGAQQAVPIPDRLWDSATAEYRAYTVQDPSAACVPRGFARPSALPALRATFWGDDGRLWVEHYSISGLTLEAFTPRGLATAVVAAPPRDPDVEPSAVGNRLAVATLTSDSLPLVRIYALPR